MAIQFGDSFSGTISADAFRGTLNASDLTQGTIPAARFPTSGINATAIGDGSVTNTEFQALSTVTSNIQTQLNNRVVVNTAFATLTSTGDLTIADRMARSGNANTAIRFPSNDTVSVETAGTEKLRITSAGNVGIGTTAPNQRLTVSGNISATGTMVVDASSTSTALRVTQRGSGNVVEFEDDTNPDSTPFIVNNLGQLISGSTTAVAANAGLQLLSEISTAPNANIVLVRSSNDTSNAAVSISKTRGTTSSRTSVNTGDNFGAVDFTGFDGSAFITSARILATSDGTPGTNDMPGRLTFSTTAAGEPAVTERMRITNQGRVGIGTTTPNQTLTVAGNISATGDIFVSGNSSFRQAISANSTIRRLTETFDVNKLPVTSNAQIAYNLASFRYNTSNFTGAIVFTAPTSLTTIMHWMEIDGYLYESTGPFKCVIQGYKTSIWNTTGLYKQLLSEKDIPMYWGVAPNGNSCLVLSADPLLNWPQIHITKAMFSHSNGGQLPYSEGWSVTAVNTLDGFTGLSAIPTVTKFKDLTITGSGVVEANSPNTALRITQRGSGNALVVEDSTTPDATPFVITSAGNVGIGTSTPGRTLTVSGNISATNGIAIGTVTGAGVVSIGNNRSLTFESTNGFTTNLSGFNLLKGTDNNFYVDNYDKDIVVRGPGAAQRIRITEAGNVGIGTSSPLYILDVAGTIRAQATTGSGDCLIIGNDTKLVDINTANICGLYGQANNDRAGIKLGSSGPTLYGSETGNLGIGTTAPTASLHVSGGNCIVEGGNISINRTSSDYNAISLTNTSGVQVQLNANGNFEGNLRTVTNHNLSFSTNNIERMRITNSGNVGIGTSSPLRSLHLQSSSSSEMILEQTNALANFRKWNFVTDGGNSTTASNFYLRILNDAGNNTQSIAWHVNGTRNTMTIGDADTGTGKLSIKQGAENYTSGGLSLIGSNTTNRWNLLAATNGHLYFGYNAADRAYILNTTGGYNTVSDSRLKKNITNCTYGLKDVEKLRPVEYNMKDESDTSKKHLGFIAQEVKEVIDNVVTNASTSSNEEMYFIDKSELVPVLVKAIQELKTELDSVKQELQALKG